MNRELIQLNHICFSYEKDAESTEGAPAPDALRDISFSVARGEYIAVIGHNGSGKSTLAKIMNLILTPTSGELVIDGEPVPHPDIPEEVLLRVRRKVGMVFQNPDNQLVATLVEEDVAFGPENLGIPREELTARVHDALAAVDMLSYARHAPHKLSGGQKQRVAIAGVLAMKPDCMIFDESTAMLDPRGRREILATIRRLNREEGIAVILITHHMNEAAEADRVIVMDDGVIRMDAPPETVFSSVQKLEELGLEIPQGTALTQALREAGLPVREMPLTPQGCAEAILHALGKEGAEK